MPSVYNNSPEGNIDRVVRQLNSGISGSVTDYEDTALSNAVRFNIFFQDKYRHADYRGRNAPKYDRELETQNISRLTREFTGKSEEDRASTTLGQAIGHTKAYNAFSALDNDLANLLQDSNNTLKRLGKNFYNGDTTASDNYFSSKNLFNYVYSRDYSNGLLNQSTSNSNLSGGELIEDIATDAINRIAKNDILSTLQNKSINLDNFSKIKEVGVDALSYKDVNGDKTNSGYVNRPGVLPFLYLFESAQSRIVIDTFQFQNKTISDYLYNVIERRVESDENFQVVFRLGYPQGADGKSATDPTTYDILGPNLIQIMKFGDLNRRLKERFGDRGDRNYITFETQDRKHHPKLYYTDQIAAIGTANLTSPIGSKLEQAGSNFETMRFFHNRLGSLLNESNYKTIAPSNSFSSKDIAESLVFKQIENLISKSNISNDSKFMARRGQIGLAGDISEHLSATINFAHRDSSNSRYKLLLVLDQAFLLQHDETLSKKASLGEMGIENEDVHSRYASRNNRRESKYKKIQTNLFELLATDRASVVIDPKNLHSNVVIPLYEDILSNEQTRRSFEEQDFDFKKLAGQGNLKEQRQRLSRLGFTDETRQLQIIALASGNIRSASVPRQHTKSYGLFDLQDNSLLSYYLGSSNLGAYSLGFKDTDNSIVNEEYGYTLMSEQLRKRMNLNTTADYSLNSDQELEELRLANSHLIHTWSQLGNNSIQSLTFNDVAAKPLWERDVDAGALLNLKKRLTDITTRTGINSGFEITPKFNATSNKINSLLISINTSEISGFNDSNLPSSNQKLKMEVSMLRSGIKGDEATAYIVGANKLISPSLFVNNNPFAEVLIPFGEKPSKERKRSNSISPKGMNEESALHRLGYGESVHLSSQDTFISMIGSLASETIYRTLVEAPTSALTKMDTSTQKNTLINYLTSSSMGIRDSGITPLLETDSLSVDNLLLFREEFLRRYSTSSQPQALRNAALLHGIDLYDESIGGKESKRQIELERFISKIDRLIYSTVNAREEGVNPTNIFSRSNLIHSDILPSLQNLINLFPEMTLDVISNQGDYSYSQQLEKEIREIPQILAEGHLSPGQYRTYGGPQGKYRTLLLGVGSSQEDTNAIHRMNVSQSLPAGDIRNITMYNRYTALPNGAGTNMGDFLIRAIAGGDGSQTGGVENKVFGLSSRAISDVHKPELIEFLGLGSIVYKSEALKSLEQFRSNLNLSSDDISYKKMLQDIDERFADKDRILNFYTGTREKISQLPQRLKNAFGSRPLYTINSEVQSLFESSKGAGVDDYIESYLEKNKNVLQNKLNSILNRNGLSQEDKERYRIITDDWFNKDYQLGAIFSGQIRKVLAQPAADYLEEKRSEIEEILGTDSTFSGIGKELLRVQALLAGMSTQGYGSMTGGEDRLGKRSIVAIQLGGAYTDVALANPEYGSIYNADGSTRVDGFIEGNIETSSKRFKASMISREGVSFYTQRGDVVMFDENTGRYLGYRKGKILPGQIVTKAGGIRTIGGIVENQPTIDNEPSFADIHSAVYKRRGENSLEYIIDTAVSQPGLFDSNQLQQMSTFLRAVKGGGGRRIEGTSSGSLVKGVLNYTSRDKNLTPDMTGAEEDMNFFEYLTWQVNKSKWGGVFKDNTIDKTQISGLYNPSNFKSFIFSHGSVIARDQSLFDKLLPDLSNSNSLRNYTEEDIKDYTKKTAAALVLNFGLEFISDYRGVNSNDPKSDIKIALMSAALKGELGSYYQGLALNAHILSGDPESALLKQSSYNSLSTPHLGGISAIDIISALSGTDTTGNLLSKVRTTLELNSSDRKKEYINLSDIRQRQSSIILGAIDVVHQLSNQEQLIKLPTDINYDDLSTQQKLRFITGILEKEAKEDEGGVAGLIQGLTQRVGMIMMYADIAQSQSKDPGGATLKGRVEGQHLIRPMLSQFEAFKEGGQISYLTKAVAGMMAAITKGSASQYYSHSSISNIKSHNILDSFTLSPFFQQHMLGVYASGTHPEEFVRLQKEYRKIVGFDPRLSEDSDPNKPKSISGLAEAIVKNDTNAIEGFEKQLRGIETELSTLSKKYGIFKDKAAGTSSAEAVVGAMSHNRMSLFIPDISISEAEGGGFIVNTNRSKGFYTFLPSGKDLEALGVQYGEYVDELVSNTREIAAGLAPGSSINRILNRLSYSTNTNNIVLTNSEVKELQDYIYKASTMVQLMAENSAGVRLQAISGGSTSFAGAVTTPVTSWLVPNSTVVLAQSVLDEAGLFSSKDNYIKSNILTSTTEDLGRTDERLYYAIENQENIRLEEARIKRYQRMRLKLRSYSNTGKSKIEASSRSESFGLRDRVANNKQEISSLQNRRYLLQQQVEAIITGTSPAGSERYNFGVQKSATYKRLYEESLIPSSQLGTLDPTTASTYYISRLANLDTIEKTIKSDIDSLSKSKHFSGKGDAYANTIVLKEMEHWYGLIKLEQDSINTTLNKDISVRLSKKDRLKYETQTKIVKELPIPIQGFYGIGKQDADFIQPGLLEGRFAGNLPQRSISTNIFKGLKDEYERSQLLTKRIDRTISEITNFSQEIESSSFGRNLSPEQINLLRNNIESTSDLLTRLHRVKLELQGGEEGDRVKVETRVAITELQAIFAQWDYTSLSSAMVFRSPPPGGTDPHIQQFSLIKGIKELNQYSNSIGNYARLPLIVDEIRNSTSTYLNPVGINTLALGDFDGDPYTSILNYIGHTEAKVGDLEARKDNNDIKIARYNREIEEYTSYLTNSNNPLLQTKDPVLETKILDIESKIDGINQSNKSIDDQIGLIRFKTDQLKSNLTNAVLPRARKELSNYIGLDERIFLSSQEQDSKGNIGWLPAIDENGIQRNSLDIEALHSFIEQGHGIFGGLEDKGKDIVKLKSYLSKIVDFNTDTNTFDRITISSPEGDTTANQQFIQNRVTNLLSNQSNLADDERSFLQSLLNKPELTTALHQTLVSFSQSDDLNKALQSDTNANLRREQIYQQEFNRFIGGSLYNKSTAHESATKLIAMGSGFSLEESGYQMLQTTLETAGGQILGKTYNSIIGTLYADSPVISLGHAITRDTKVEQSVREHLNKLIDKNAVEGKTYSYTLDGKTEEITRDTTDKFFDTLKQSMEFSEGLQGYMKNIHQLLRDSIKLKKGSDQAKALEQQARAYEAASGADQEEERRSILNSMSRSLGPGSGLQALLRLDTLVNSNYTGIDNDTLASQFGLKEDQTRYQIIQDRLQSIGVLQKNEEGVEKRSASLEDNTKIARYQTAEDMISLVTAYRYEKAIEAGRSLGEYLTLSKVERLRNSFNDSSITEDNAQDKILERYLGINDSDDLPAYKSIHARQREALAATLKIDSPYAPNDPSQLSLEYKTRVTEIQTKNSISLEVFDETYFNTVKATEAFLGKDGQRLDRFTNYDATRRNLVAGLGGRTEEERSAIFNSLSEDNADLNTTMDQLISSGKIAEGSMGVFTESMLSQYEHLGLQPGASRESILEVMFSPNRMTTNDPATAAYSMLNSFLQMSNNLPDFDENDYQNKDKGINIPVGKNGESTAKFENFHSFLYESLREADTGRKITKTEEYLNAIVAENITQTPEELAEQFLKAKGINIDSLSQGEKEGRIQQLTNTIKQLGSTNRIEFSESASASKRISPRRGLAGKLGDRAIDILKSQETGNQLEVFLPIGLSIVGQALANGDIDPEATQELIGSSVAALAYSRESFTTTRPGIKAPLLRKITLPNKNAAITGSMAGAFKFRAALAANDNDIVGAVVETAVRELAFNATTAFIAPKLIEKSTELLGINRFSVDSDRYVATKTIAGTATGAILSAGLAVFASNLSARAVKNIRQLPDLDIVEAALGLVDDRSRQIRENQLDIQVVDSESADDIPINIEETTSFYTDSPGEIDIQLQGDTGEMLPTNLFNFEFV